MRPYRYLYVIMITILLLPAELSAVPNTNATAFQLNHSTPAEIDISLLYRNGIFRRVPITGNR